MRRKPMVPNDHKYIFTFKFYISVKADSKTKLFDEKASRTTTYMKMQPSGSQIRDPVLQNQCQISLLSTDNKPGLK